MKGEYKTPFESNVHAPYERILVSQPLKYLGYLLSLRQQT